MGSKYLCAQISIGTRCFLCTMTLVSIQRSTSPSNVQASNHLRIRQLLMSSAESELSFRSQLCPGKWQEDSVIFSLLPLMSAVTSYYLKMNSKAKQCSFDIIYREAAISTALDKRRDG